MGAVRAGCTERRGQLHRGVQGVAAAPWRLGSVAGLQHHHLLTKLRILASNLAWGADDIELAMRLAVARLQHHDFSSPGLGFRAGGAG